MSSHMTLNQ